MTELQKQIKLLKKYGVTNYTVENSHITINESLDLRSLTSADKDFLKGTTLNESLDLRSLTSADKDFLKGTTLNGWLDLGSLTSVPPNFLKGTTINWGLDLWSLTSVPADFLKGTTLNGWLYLWSLTSVPADFLKGTTLNGWLDLRSLTSVPADFLKGTTLNGGLYLWSLTSVPADFLKGTTINGSLYLWSLTSVPADFLKGTTINGSLDLRSLTSVPADFLKGTTINGSLDLRSLTLADQARLNKNVKQLKVGYNAKGGYCFFDGILSRVLSVKEAGGVTIYRTPNEYICRKGEYTAHGATVKKAKEDLLFKINAEKIKKSPILADTKMTIMHYRLITGACESGVQNWLNNNPKVKEGIKAKDLLPILEQTNAYGLDAFKKLIRF